MMKCLVQYRGEDFTAAALFIARRVASRVGLRQFSFWVNLAYGLLVGFVAMWVWNTLGPGRSTDRMIVLVLLLTSFVLVLAREPLTLLLWQKGVRRLWGTNNVPDEVVLDDAGVHIDGGMGRYFVQWPKIEEIVEEKGYLYFCYRGAACLYTPIRSFQSPQEFADFKRTAIDLHARHHGTASRVS
jgi:hypothetical protein